MIPPPVFIATDPEARLAQAIKSFERITNRELKSAQPERLTLGAFAYELNLHAIQVQEAMRQGLVDFARFPMLDYLGRFYGITRLPPAAAKTTLRFSQAQIAAGTRVAAGDCLFATDLDLIGGGEVTATAVTPGPSGNGFAPGQINRLLIPMAGVAVANITPSTGGADQEGDEALRARILDAPEKMTNAGSRGAYEQRVREVSPAIIATAVHSKRPGDVDITLLTAEGPPPNELIALVQAHLSDRMVRPMGDLVTVRAPLHLPYEIDARITLTRVADAETTRAACHRAAFAYAAAQRLQLGGDIVPSQIIRALMVDGVHDLKLISPPQIKATPESFADCRKIVTVIEGRCDD